MEKYKFVPHINLFLFQYLCDHCEILYSDIDGSCYLVQMTRLSKIDKMYMYIVPDELILQDIIYRKMDQLKEREWAGAILVIRPDSFCEEPNVILKPLAVRITVLSKEEYLHRLAENQNKRFIMKQELNNEDARRR